MRISDVIAMAALVVTILIALIIAGNLSSVSDTIGAGMGNTTAGATYNTTAGTLFANTWSGLTLASIGIIVAAAVGILSLVVGALGRAGGGF